MSFQMVSGAGLAFELSVDVIVILLLTGFVAGVVNTLAGGGSNLTVPALIMMGMPADIANATNRVGVLLQSIIAVKGYNKYGKIDTQAIGSVLWPAVLGGLVGASCASYLPVWLLKPVLLGVMTITTLVILIQPSTTTRDTQSPQASSRSWVALAMMAVAGFYGGFVQAGVGFILLAVLVGGLHYDLVSANALKMVCTAAFTAIALLVFVARDQVAWLPGLLLACGAMLGAHLAVKISIEVSQKTLKWLLFLMTLIACGAALLIDS